VRESMAWNKPATPTVFYKGSQARVKLFRNNGR